MLTVFLYVPSVSNLLGLAPLTSVRLFTSLFFAFVLFGLNECVKILYRMEMEKQNKELGRIAVRWGRGLDASDEEAEKRGQRFIDSKV